MAKSVPVPAPQTDLVVPPTNAEALIAKAIEHQLPVDTMERLLALRERLRAEQAREAFFTALTRFQAECPIIVKSNLVNVQTQGGGYKYQFAPLDKIVTTVQPLLAKHGFSYSFDSEDADKAKVTICRVHHVGGHTEASSFTAPIDGSARMSDTHKSASAHTYAKRYAFCNGFGILTGEEDDDAAGEAAKQAFPAPKRTTNPPDKPVGKGGGDSTASGGHIEPAPSGGPTISEKDKVRLEGLCRKYAEAWGISPEKVRDNLKQWILDTFKKEHFLELNPVEYGRTLRWFTEIDAQATR